VGKTIRPIRHYFIIVLECKTNQTAAMLPKPVEVDARHGHDVVLLDEDDEINDKSTASTSVIHALSATAQEADASVPVEDENVVDNEDDTSDAESFFEEILHNVLEGEEAESEDKIGISLCSPLFSPRS